MWKKLGKLYIVYSDTASPQQKNDKVPHVKYLVYPNNLVIS